MSQRLLEPLPRPPSKGPECRLEIAALLEKRTHTSGIGWRITVQGHAESPHTRTLQRADTLLRAELTAVREGVRGATRWRGANLELRVPDRRVAGLIEGTGPSRFSRGRAAAERVRPLLAGFASVHVVVDFLPDPDLRSAVAEALDAGLVAAAVREQHRVWAMEQIVARARDVQLERTDAGWIANGRYHVQLEPMRCECPAWTARWAKAPIGARRASRLPCKHLVALARHEGITVPADLAQLARRAPP
ncbi:MAG TPA: SWIM zinc finger family protein [Thermoplasmata archaeon]|nr:SWIM zinc finger family protein [Thermoplasmata archaeon]